MSFGLLRLLLLLSAAFSNLGYDVSGTGTFGWNSCPKVERNEGKVVLVKDRGSLPKKCHANIAHHANGNATKFSRKNSRKTTTGVFYQVTTYLSWNLVLETYYSIFQHAPQVNWWAHSIGHAGSLFACPCSFRHAARNFLNSTQFLCQFRLHAPLYWPKHFCVN